MSRFYFSLSFRRNRDQTKQTLGVPLLFQSNFLLVVRADNLIWQIYFFIGFFRHDARSVLKFGFSLPSVCTQTFPRINQVSKLNSGRVSCYMLIKYKGKVSFFWYQEGFLNTNTQNIIWCNTSYVRKNNVFSYNIVVSEV